MKKVSALKIGLIISILANSAFVFYYFYKIVPGAKDIRAKLVKYEYNKKNESECGPGTTGVFSRSSNKFICIDNKSKALSECSEKFSETVDAKVLSGLKTIDNIDKFRELAMKMCMQGKGFEY